MTSQGPPSDAWTTAWVRASPFGTLAAVHLPTEPDAPPAEVLRRLHTEERAKAEMHAGYRLLDWVGGRLAWHAARESLGLPLAPLGVADGGGPAAPSGLSVSLSHKRGLAVALVGVIGEGTVGVDVEGGRARMAVADRVLTASELEEVARLPEPERWASVELRFSMKEAVYKAIHPHLGRYVGFEECVVAVRGERDTTATLTRRDGEPALSLTCAWERWQGWTICQVRARRA